VALYCWLAPGTIVAIGGKTLIATSWSCTASDVEPAIEPDVAEIIVVPELAEAASPIDPDVLPIVATVADEEAHVTDVVMFAVDPSVYSPVAVNCCEPPIGMDGLCGLTSMAAKIAFVTVRLPDPVTVPDLARMTVLPLPMLVAIPLLPEVLLTVATLGTDELQWAELVMSCVEPSVNVPTAVKVWFIPKGIAAVAGLTAIETTEAGVTVSSVDPPIPPRVAVMAAVPVARELPSALELTVATTVLLDPQVAEVVRS
jgi:hypothetical protein